LSTEPSELSYAVRLPVVGKYLGQLSLVLAALTLVPLAFCLSRGELPLSGRYLIVIGALALAGGALVRLRGPTTVQVNEGMIVVALTFLLAALAMTYPLMGAGMTCLDAFFEAVSGVTTTGLSTRATLTGAPASFLFARAWMQWYGGLGIVALSLALVMRPGPSAKGLAALDSEAEDLVGNTKANARRMLGIYLVLTAAAVLCLWGTIGNFFGAVLHALAAVSTGGFAPDDASLGALAGWPARASVILFCFLGAIPLAYYHRFVPPRGQQPGNRLQVLALVLAGLAVTCLLGLFMSADPSLTASQALRDAPLMAFSAQTTAGFSSVSPARLDGASKLTLIAAMTVGGGLGSTAGGFKILRLLILFQLLRMMLVRTRLPRHAVMHPGIAGKHLETDDLSEALALILLFVGVIVLSWAPFLAQGYDAIDSLFEVVSAIGTVGLSTGVTAPQLPGALKGVLCADMLLGRLEIVAWLVLLSPGSWFGRRLEKA